MLHYRGGNLHRGGSRTLSLSTTYACGAQEANSMARALTAITVAVARVASAVATAQGTALDRRVRVGALGAVYA